MRTPRASSTTTTITTTSASTTSRTIRSGCRTTSRWCRSASTSARPARPGYSRARAFARPLKSSPTAPSAGSARPSTSRPRCRRPAPARRQLAANAGIDWSVGGPATEAQIDRVAAWMADALVAALTQSPAPKPVDALWLTDPLEPVEGIAGVMFSGGVAEYVYGREERDFGDLGKRLGLALRKRLDAPSLPYALLPAGECIRATAIGASEYSVQLSGNTVYISNPAALLPRKNLQVLQPGISLAGEIDVARG